MAHRLSPFIIRQQSKQLAREIESGAVSPKQAMKKLGGLVSRKGK